MHYEDIHISNWFFTKKAFVIFVIYDLNMCAQLTDELIFY